MTVSAPFPANGEDPWGDKIQAWSNEVEDDLNNRLSDETLGGTYATAEQGAKADEALPAESLDAEVATLAADPASELGKVLNSDFAKSTQAVLGNRFVFLGDSITIGNDDMGALKRHGDSWPTYASILSLQRIYYVYNAGVGGNTSGMALARFDTDVTPHAPTTVTIGVGTNDAGLNVPLSEYSANVMAMVNKCREIGAAPVLCTVPPRADRRGEVSLYNAWLRQYASSQGVGFIDFNTLLVDPATGGYMPGYDSGDGIHPSPAGHAAMGALASSSLSPILPAWGPGLPTDNGDPYNLIGNGLMIDAGSGGLAAGWAAYGGTTGVTRSIVPDDAAIVGNWQRVQVESGAGRGVSRAASVTPEPGDIIQTVGRIRSAGAKVTVQLSFAEGASGYVRPVDSSEPLKDGTWAMEAEVPSGTTGVSVIVTASAGADFSIGQVAVRNLTALGLV